MSSERERIKRIVELAARHPARAASGLDARVGLESLDDCAVVPMPGGVDLVVGSDFVRGPGFHLFKSGVLTWHDLGYYLIAANASDLAAMGAVPVGVLVVLRYSALMNDRDFEGAMNGILLACADFRMPLLGGDTGGYEVPVLSAAALGVVPQGKALLRSNGRPGDRLFVSGQIGAAGAALAYFARGKGSGTELDQQTERELARSWQRPQAPLEQSALLVREGLSSCAIDTSDGLKAACRQLAEASRVDVVLQSNRIPLSPLAVRVADAMGVDSLELALGDSVDFRLVFACSGERGALVQEMFTLRGWDLFEIGRLAPPQASPTVYLETKGSLIPAPGIEWDQGDVLAIDRIRENSLRRRD